MRHHAVRPAVRRWWSGPRDPVVRVLRVLVLVLWPTVFFWLLPGQHRPGAGWWLAVACVVAYSLGAVLLLAAGSRPDRVLRAVLATFTVAAVTGALAGPQPEMALLVPLFLGALGVIAGMRLDRRGLLVQVALSSAAGVVCVAYVAEDAIKVVVSSVAVVAGIAAPAVAIGRLRAQLGAARAREHRLARTDALTGALNRRGLFEAADELCGLGAPLVLVALDLDGFKQLNDTYGHAVGDEVLVAVVAGLRDVGEDAVCGTPVLVARLGGEEFLLMAPSTGAPTGTVAERVRAAASVSVPCGGGRTTASVGAVLATPPEAVEDRRAWLLRRMDDADRLMYEAKRSGGDRALVG